MIKPPKSQITVMTEDTPNNAGVVTMINVLFVSALGRVKLDATNRAIGYRHHFVVFFKRNSIAITGLIFGKFDFILFSPLFMIRSEFVSFLVGLLEFSNPMVIFSVVLLGFLFLIHVYLLSLLLN